MEHLFPPNILQTTVQILDLLYKILHLAFIRTLNRARLSNRQVEAKFDLTARCAAAQPAAAGTSIRWRKAETVIPAIGSRKGESPLGGSTLRNHAVIIVECLIDGNLNANVGRCFE